jgi:transposase
VSAGDRSEIRIVYAERDVKLWRAQLPTVDEVRPGRCPACEAPSRPAGGNLGLHGHGLRERDQWGPTELGTAAAVIGILARRYRCQSCDAVIVVLPRGVVRRRLYSGGTIAIALALWAVAGLAPAAVRVRVSPHRIIGPTAVAGWASLRRWSRAVRAGRLFAAVRASPETATLRQVAARAATTLAAMAGGGSIESAAFLGARM